MSDSYSPAVGLVYVFNLIIGTGALTLPLAFSQAGLLCGVITLIILSLFSFITASWVIEAMAAANAVLNTNSSSSTPDNQSVHSSSSINNQETINHVENRHSIERTSSQVFEVHENDDDRPLLSSSGSPQRFNFEITKRIELGAIA